MTQLEILNLALYGVLAQLGDEHRRSEKARKLHKDDSDLTIEMREALWEKYDELVRLIDREKER